MIIYGVALLAFCMLVGAFVGELIGRLIGIDANVGGVGISMLLLLFLAGRFKDTRFFGGPAQQGVTF
jgi:malonate transporter MadL subunit